MRRENVFYEMKTTSTFSRKRENKEPRATVVSTFLEVRKSPSRRRRTMFVSLSSLNKFKIGHKRKQETEKVVWTGR